MPAADPTSAELPGFVSRQIRAARYWFLDLVPGEGVETVAVCGGWEQTAPDYEVRRATFPYFAVEFVEDGSGEVELHGRRFPLHPGTAFADGPGVPHVIRTSADRPLRKHYVDFRGDRAAAILAAGPLAEGRAAVVGETAEVLEIFALLHRNGTNDSASGRAICGALVEVLLHKLNERGATPGPGEGGAAATYRTARDYLRQHCLRISTLEEAAAELQLTPAYLTRLFRRFDRTSPYRWLQRLKMNHAAAQLLTGDKAVGRVAAELGFADVFHFSKVFKQVYGVSPTAFRRRWRPSG